MPKLKKKINYSILIKKMSLKRTWRPNPTESKNMKPSKRIETQKPKTSYSILSLSLYPLSLTTHPFIFILSQDDLKDATSSSSDDSPPDPTTPHDSSEWDKFGSEFDSPHKSKDKLNLGS